MPQETGFKDEKIYKGCWHGKSPFIIAFCEKNGTLNKRRRKTSKVFHHKKIFYPIYTEQKNYLDCDLDLNLVRNRECDPEDVPIYTGHSLFNTTNASHCCSLFSHCYIAVHLISGFEWTRSRSRSSVNMGQILSIHGVLFLTRLKIILSNEKANISVIQISYKNIKDNAPSTIMKHRKRRGMHTTLRDLSWQFIYWLFSSSRAQY